MGRKILYLFLAILAFSSFYLGIKNIISTKKEVTRVASENHFQSTTELAQKYPPPTPTSRFLTFAEMNSLYGPCAVVPTLMYHHIENLDQAKKEGLLGLAVSPENFQKQMEYLKLKGYQTIKMADLINFFDSGSPLPKKSILITFDDGYEDFATNVYPLLNSLNFNATLFLPTGLADNPGYLTWDQIKNISSNQNIYVANHTWSHKSTKAQKDVVEKEILAADRQLTEKNLNALKIFAYPYGEVSDIAKKTLESSGYKLAFTTRTGSILCKKLRFELPRVRPENSPLSSYGF